MTPDQMAELAARLREAIADHPLSPIHGYAADIAALLDRLDQSEKERATLWEAVGLASTIKADMEIDTSDPLGMMQQVARHADGLARENERLAAELANLQIAFNDWRVLHSTIRMEAEIERLRAENDDCKAALTRTGNEMRELRDKYQAVRAENEKLRGDAARYRWLRGREDGRYMTVYAFRTDVDEVCLGDDLDAAIDAARAAEQAHGIRQEDAA